MYSVKINNGISLSAVSIQGKREQQQDFYIYRQLRDRTIAIVCDGMGGLQGGNIASRKAAEILVKDLENVDPGRDMYRFFRYEMEKLDDAIYNLRNADGSRLGGGTTVVAILLIGSQLYWFSVGDSKLYYARQQELYCVTRAHNYALCLEEKRRKHEISDEDYNREAVKGEQLISYLGMGMTELYDGNYSPFPVQQSDRLLLCTDGLYRSVPAEEIASIMRQRGSTDRICKMFENAITAKNRSNQDNATWIVLQKVGD